jgi:hypothetical protein
MNLAEDKFWLLLAWAGTVGAFGLLFVLAITGGIGLE